MAIGADFIAPYNVNDPASANVIDARLPPGSSGMFGGTFLLGTDPQGRDMLSAVIFGLRTSLLVGGLSVLLAALRRHHARPAQRILRRLARRRGHAHRRCSAQLPGDPDRAADRWRKPHRRWTARPTTRSPCRCSSSRSRRRTGSSTPARSARWCWSSATRTMCSPRG